MATGGGPLGGEIFLGHEVGAGTDELVVGACACGGNVVAGGIVGWKYSQAA